MRDITVSGALLVLNSFIFILVFSVRRFKCDRVNVQAEVQARIKRLPSLLGVISVEALVRQFVSLARQFVFSISMLHLVEVIDVDLEFDFNFDFDSEHFWRGGASSIVSHPIIDVVLLWLIVRVSPNCHCQHVPITQLKFLYLRDLNVEDSEFKY